MNPTFWTAIKPIAAQAARDFLRTVGTALAAHGFITDGAGTEAFIGAGMTLAGLFWGWFTTSGYLQLAGLLKKLTATKTQAAAVEVAKVMPSAEVTGAADKAKVIATAAGVIKVLVVALLLSALIAPSAFAQSRPKLTGNIAADIANATGKPVAGVTGAPVTDAQNFFNAMLLPDLQYALKLSQAAKNNITGDCYQAWIDIITTQQTAVKNADGIDLAMPDPHVITEFEKIVELRNALQPESTFMVKCSPVASMIKKDITGFIGIVISGGAGLATLVPGL